MGINFKLALPPLIGLVLIIFFIQGYWQPLQLEKAKNTFEQHTQELLTLSQAGIILNLLEGDLGALYSGLELLEKTYENRWVNVAVYSSDGKQLYPILKRASQITIDDSGFIHIINPLYFEGTQIGRLELNVDWGQEKLAVIDNINIVRNLIIFLVVIGLLISTLSQYRLIYKPLKKLGIAAGNIARGNFKTELPLASNDEIGELTNSFNTMMADLAFQKNEVDLHHGQLERIAHYDELTGLPNRILLIERVNQAILQSQHHHNSLAVVFLDLDGFKAINDKHGHTVGDELLVIVSLRMKEALREGDTLARVGGDEFAILANLINGEDFQPELKRLLFAASEPITIGSEVLNVSASIGVTQYPQDNAGADILMRHADQAMYMAKQAGKNRYHLFDTAHDDAAKIRQESLKNIKAGLDSHEFVLYYQPKVNMLTGEKLGVEALIRWQHPVRGLVPPLDFLPIIEGHAISLVLGEWVIDTALTQLSHWKSIGITLSMSVNISAYQLQQTNFVTRLAELLAAHPDVSPNSLELEVLETSALDDISQVAAVMNACNALGVHFAIDDFGTGYSSLTYLRRLPASLIKIDQSFVRDMLNNADDLAIVAGVISLAKAFQREVIAEGVETIEHGTALLQLGCELAQGYGIARPMPASDIPAWLKGWQPDVAWQS